ncbi:uncharacterized protein LOC129587963 [Paramacrobiotus metropolitanus]|uniref:uncharacterized protein LOC129587963 n=1 Tax=Paramacrobiotus metropolitanus TaxID=2943436 RepID=UPI00244647D1|nr:uncharacterized protein LOC129587963 [Paramacrobiotus metropolitanus]
MLAYNGDDTAGTIRLRMLVTIGFQSFLNVATGVAMIVAPPLLLESVLPVSLYVIGGMLIFFALLGLFWMYQLQRPLPEPTTSDAQLRTIFHPEADASATPRALIVFKRYTYSLLFLLLVTFAPVLIQITGDIFHHRGTRLRMIIWPVAGWVVSFLLNLVAFVWNVVVTERYAERLKEVAVRQPLPTPSVEVDVPQFEPLPVIVLSEHPNRF